MKRSGILQGIFLTVVLVIISMGIVCANNGTSYKQVKPDSKESNVVLASDIHYSYSWSIAPLGAHSVSWQVHKGDGVYGSFSSSGNDISFYLVDSQDYVKWDNGESFSYYKGSEDVYSGSFTFKIPYDDTWYFIFDNRDSIFHTSDVTFDLYMDTTPPTFTVNLATGSTYSNVKTIIVNANDAKFSVYSISLYIDNSLVTTQYSSSLTYNWDTKDYANGQHTIQVSVSDTVGNAGYDDYIVNVNNYVATTSNPTSSTNPTTSTTSGGNNPAALGALPIIPVGLGLIGLVMLIGGVFAFKGKGSLSSASASVPAQGPPPDGIAQSYSESAITSAPAQVVCPFCGSRTQAGTKTCQVCGAEL